MNAAEYGIMRSVEDGHWWYRGLRSMLRLSFPGREPGVVPVILDAGCGTGANLRLLRKLVPEGVMIGLDRAAEALDRMESDSNTHFCRGNVNQLPLADDSVDVVFAGDLLGQQGVVIDAAIRHFFRVLKPGGVVLLNVPAFPWLRGEHDVAVHVEKRFQRRELSDELKGAGFETITARFWNSILMLPLLVHRVMSRSGRIDAREARSDLTLQSGAQNATLSFWIEWETRLAMLVGIPFGSSIFATARKPMIPTSQNHG